ncbi:chemotaxis protein CheW [Exilibacterium tricleocarpae]|uniref:Chemotaxis protein CheW n=1 Tax=Exilibacterium tricleocarpae TaxID=2591008 RepID=A0A545SXG8_9GAMM|nr:chemotaxis protein CheW [Exilibacterium tricleocarpae]TQV69639.1 chemotaxis protein CheW [Exilibacterium tricleocarpae]
MNSRPALENQTVEEVASLLLPLEDRLLLLPTVTVAEMVPFRQPEPEADTPDWYLGAFSWREQPVPLLSFEVLNGEARPNPNSRSRVAVLNHTGVSEKLPFIAIPTLGIPRLARVNPDEISVVETADKKPFELMHVSIAGETAVIPDVSAMEQAYMDFRRG